jgi:hypothetical protein
MVPVCGANNFQFSMNFVNHRWIVTSGDFIRVREELLGNRQGKDLSNLRNGARQEGI